MKKLLLSIVALLLASIKLMAQMVTVDNIVYTISTTDSCATLSDGKSASGALTIPSVVNYNGMDYPVTTIGSAVFYNCLKLTSVVIPNTVTIIRDYAFSECSGLETITFGNSVTTIESGAFFKCTSLDSITIPHSVTRIGNAAFNSCNHVTSVIIGNSVDTIGTGGFTGCNLTSIIIPQSVSFIGADAFRGCTEVKNVSFLGNLCQNSIEENAFGGVGSATNLIALTLPESWGNVYLPINDTSVSWYGGYFSSNRWFDFEVYKNDIITEINAAIGVNTDETVLAIVNSAKTSINKAISIEAVNAIKEKALADIVFAKFKAEVIAQITSARQGIQNSYINNWIDGAINDIKKAGIDTEEKVHNIADNILGIINIFQDGKAETLGEMATPCTDCTAVKVTKGDKIVTLYAPESVEYMRVEIREID